MIKDIKDIQVKIETQNEIWVVGFPGAIPEDMKSDAVKLLADLMGKELVSVYRYPKDRKKDSLIAGVPGD